MPRSAPLGLALQGTLSNIAAGLMLLWLRPFRVGDQIEIGAFSGVVKEVGLFASEIHTMDGIYQFVPNSELWKKRIVNYTRMTSRMVDLKFGVGYGDDLGRGKAALLAAAAADGALRLAPAPRAATALLDAAKLALDAAGPSIPFPQRELHVKPISKVVALDAAE